MMMFELDDRSGVPVYMQLIQQVRHASRLGIIKVGDQLPTARAVVEALAINPNTVLKAYRELERDGLVTTRPGQGTFMTAAAQAGDLASHVRLRRQIDSWIAAAEQAGLNHDDMEALYRAAIRESLLGTVGIA